MKYVAERGYTDVQLNRHVDKGAVLEDEYKKENVELTEERINYLVNERKLYISVEEIPEGNVEDITPVDEVPEGETVIDRVDIVEDKEPEEIEPKEEDTKVEADKEETKATESEVTGEEKNKTKNNSKATSKTSTKNEEK